jgi:cytochrome b6-f complex iron-sulfur subunit
MGPFFIFGSVRSIYTSFLNFFNFPLLFFKQTYLDLNKFNFMERRKFFSIVGMGVTAVVVSNALISCKKDTVNPAPTNVDFTLDINSASAAALKDKGGYIYQNNLIIAHLPSDEYVALSSVCTHAGCTVQFNGSSDFPCPCHGSIFATDGSVVKGPASKSLKKYNTSLNGNSLRVFS